MPAPSINLDTRDGNQRTEAYPTFLLDGLYSSNHRNPAFHGVFSRQFLLRYYIPIPPLKDRRFTHTIPSSVLYKKHIRSISHPLISSDKKFLWVKHWSIRAGTTNYELQLGRVFLFIKSGICLAWTGNRNHTIGQGSVGTAWAGWRRLDDSLLIFWLMEASVLSSIAC